MVWGCGVGGGVRPRRPRLPRRWKPQYPSALARFTTGFGMGPGGSAPPSATGGPRPPRIWPCACSAGGSVRDRCCCRCVAARGGARAAGWRLPARGAWAPARWDGENALDHEHGSAEAVTGRRPPASRPRSLRGVLLPYGMGGFILGRASRLDAVSGSPCRARLPGAARRRATGPPAARPPRSSRTRGGPPQSPIAHSG